MATSSHLDIDLHLKEIKHLFVAPELNPLEDKRLQLSGAEEAANILRTKKEIVEKIRLNLFLLPDEFNSDLQAKTVDALSIYCDFKARENQRQLDIGRAEGWRAVMIGLIFSTICLLMISALYLIGPISETILVIFVGFFTILIWMAIWSPAEMFLYGLQPYRREIKAYNALKNAEIVIREESLHDR